VLSVLRIIKRFPITCALVVIHTLLDALIYQSWFMSTDGERDMLWLWAFLLDRPIFGLYAALRPSSGWATFLLVVFIGGIAWGLLGICLDFGVRRFLQSTRNT
jgi:hypothetical protein